MLLTAHEPRACVCKRGCFSGQSGRLRPNACPYKACAEIVVVAPWGSFGENRCRGDGLVWANGIVFPGAPRRSPTRGWRFALAKNSAPTTGCYLVGRLRLRATSLAAAEKERLALASPISHLTCGAAGSPYAAPPGAEAVCNTPCRALRQGVFLISSCGCAGQSRPASVRRMKYSSTPAPMRARSSPFIAS